MEVAFSSSFERAFKKIIKGNKFLEETFWEKVDIFIRNPRDRKLRTHKLSGQLKDLWSFSITYEVRVIFFFMSEQRAVFVDIGGHDAVY